jgi:hypothetical protein
LQFGGVTVIEADMYNAADVAIDTTVVLNVDVTAKWSAAKPANIWLTKNGLGELW